MNKTTRKTILDAHRKLAEAWREEAHAAMARQDPFRVYDAIRQSLRHDSETRTIERRYTEE